VLGGNSRPYSHTERDPWLGGFGIQGRVKKKRSGPTTEPESRQGNKKGTSLQDYLGPSQQRVEKEKKKELLLGPPRREGKRETGEGVEVPGQPKNSLAGWIIEAKGRDLKTANSDPGGLRGGTGRN